MSKNHMKIVRVALATTAICVGLASNGYAYGSDCTSRGAEFRISGKHITNCKYFTQGQVVSLSGLYRADRKGGGVRGNSAQEERILQVDNCR